jgi:hypothetical protein
MDKNFRAGAIKSFTGHEFFGDFMMFYKRCTIKVFGKIANILGKQSLSMAWAHVKGLLFIQFLANYDGKCPNRQCGNKCEF